MNKLNNLSDAIHDSIMTTILIESQNSHKWDSIYFSMRASIWNSAGCSIDIELDHA